MTTFPDDQRDDSCTAFARLEEKIAEKELDVIAKISGEAQKALEMVSLTGGGAADNEFAGFDRKSDDAADEKYAGFEL
jgi:hypothetical protein